MQIMVKHMHTPSLAIHWVYSLNSISCNQANEGYIGQTHKTRLLIELCRPSKKSSTYTMMYIRTSTISLTHNSYAICCSTKFQKAVNLLLEFNVSYSATVCVLLTPQILKLGHFYSAHAYDNWQGLKSKTYLHFIL